jgi:hypothetical protein
VQLFAFGKSFNSGYLFAARHNTERKAAVYPVPVNMHGACTALAMVAAFFCAGKVKLFA